MDIETSSSGLGLRLGGNAVLSVSFLFPALMNSAISVVELHVSERGLVS